MGRSRPLISTACERHRHPAAQPLLPEAVADDDGRRAGGPILVLGERAAHDGGGIEHAKEIGRDDRRVDDLGVAEVGHDERDRAHSAIDWMVRASRFQSR